MCCVLDTEGVRHFKSNFKSANGKQAISHCYIFTFYTFCVCAECCVWVLVVSCLRHAHEGRCGERERAARIKGGKQRAPGKRDVQRVPPQRMQTGGPKDVRREYGI